MSKSNIVNNNSRNSDYNLHFASALHHNLRVRPCHGIRMATTSIWTIFEQEMYLFAWCTFEKYSNYLGGWKRSLSRNQTNDDDGDECDTGNGLAKPLQLADHRRTMVN